MESLFTRLLLATEGSDFDKGAEKMAFALAQRCQLPLAVVLPLASNPEFEALAPQIAAKMDAEAAQKIARLRQQAATASIVTDMVVRRGEELFSEIVEEARTQSSEMLIIRRRGKRGFLANLLIGEMVSQVVAHAPCHVLIVPPESTVWSQRILVAIDPNEALSDTEKTLQTAAKIAAQCELPLYMVCVVAGDNMRPFAAQCMTQWMLQATALGVTANGEIRVGKVSAEILRARETSQSDLIILNSRNPHHAIRTAIGSVAQKVIGLSDYPVLVLHT